MLYNGHQQGVALITVLFILALMTTLLVYTVEDEHLALRRLENIRDTEQAYQLAVAAELWAIKTLVRDLQQTDTDHNFEAWKNLDAATVSEGELAATIIDQQSLFNLNNLSHGRDTTWYPAFVRLVRLLELDDGLADAIVDWIDTDENQSGQFGAEDLDYLLEDPPYRAANRGFVDISELRWVKGFNREVISKLAPYVTALPMNNAKINVNTCSLPLLRILDSDIMSEADAQALIDARGEGGFTDMNEFLSQPAMSGRADLAIPLVSLDSRFFRLNGLAHYGRINYRIYSLLQRNLENAEVVIIRRQRGFG